MPQSRAALLNTAIEIRDFSYRLSNEEEILREVSFSVTAGEYLSIVGPNGAGKTTLLRCLDRILTGGTGRIDIFGRRLSDYRQRELARLVGYVPQADGRLFPFTVEEFVLMGRYPHLSPFSSISKEDRRIATEAMQWTDTQQFADRQLGTLSGGERQQVYIAAALAQGAKILLLDEPTTFLDYRHQAEVQQLLARANRESGLTIVAVTHDVNQAVLHSDRVVALCHGNVVFHGTPTEIMRAEVLERIYGTPFTLVNHPTVNLPVIVPVVQTNPLPSPLGERSRG